MQVLVMRHGIAVERDEWNQDDALRPLTPAGERKTRSAALGLKTLVPHVGVVATSPLTRAIQTAEIVASVLGAPMQVWDELPVLVEDELWDFPHLHERLFAQKNDATILLIGHEPGCSRFTSSLLTGRGSALGIEWKKAGVSCLEFKNGHGTLQWLITPKMLRALAPTQ